jgi:exonuclease SbcD
MAIKFLHTADIHLKRDEPSRLDILSWILSKAKELASGLIIAGDLFENDIEASFLRNKVRQIFEQAKDFPIFIIPGNHDYHSYSSHTYYGSNVVLFHDNPSQITLGGIKVIGVPFQPGKEFSRCIEEFHLESFDLVIAHGTLYDRKFSSIYTELGEDARYMPIYSWDVEEKMGYLALGHYHSKFTHLSIGRTEIVYPGSPVATSRRSVGMRFVSLVCIEKEGEVKVEKVPVEPSTFWEKREWMVFPGREEEKLAQIEEEIKKLKSSKVMLQAEIKGFITLGETEFREKVKEMEKKYQDEFQYLELTSLTTYWTELLENPTLALFVKKLSQVKQDELIKKKALEFTLSALKNLRG